MWEKVKFGFPGAPPNATVVRSDYADALADLDLHWSLMFYGECSQSALDSTVV